MKNKAVAEARASGKDPVIAGRVANRQAMQATKPDFDAKMKAITETRREAMAAISSTSATTPTPDARATRT